MTAVFQPNLPTARRGDFDTSVPPLDILGLTLNAYAKGQDLVRRPQMWQQQDQDRASAQDWQNQLHNRQQQVWGQQDQDRQYGIDQRPMNEQIRNLNLAQQQSHLAATNFALGSAALRLQTQTADAAIKQSAMDLVNATATGQSVVPTANGAITSYGYQGDTSPDDNSKNGIGAFVSDEEAQQIRDGKDTPNKLKAGDIALSPDVRQAVTSAGIKPGEAFNLHFADGTTHTGRYMDHTAEEYNGKKLTGRFDIYSPDGPDARNGKQVMGFSQASAGLPNADQLDRMMEVATTTKDPAIIARAQQINAANGLRPDVQFQRNSKAWNSGFDYWKSRLATLPNDVSDRMAAISGIAPNNPASTPQISQPHLWGPINQRLDNEITSYNKDPATWKRVQIAGEPRTPILPKATTLTTSSLSHLITNPDTPPEFKTAAQNAYAKIIAGTLDKMTQPPAATTPPASTTAPAPAAPAPASVPGSAPPPEAKADPDGWDKVQKLLSK